VGRTKNTHVPTGGYVADPNRLFASASTQTALCI
jgi:hypothetical protein